MTFAYNTVIDTAFGAVGWGWRWGRRVRTWQRTLNDFKCPWTVFVFVYYVPLLLFFIKCELLYKKKNLSHLELFTTLYLVIVSSQVCVTA